MKFTANRCATEGIEDVVDRCDETLAKDTRFQEADRHAMNIIGCIRDVLEDDKDSSKALDLLDELEDALTDRDTVMEDVLGEYHWTDIQIAFELGRMYCELEKRRERLRRSHLDDGRHE